MVIIRHFDQAYPSFLSLLHEHVGVLERCRGCNRNLVDVGALIIIFYNIEGRVKYQNWGGNIILLILIVIDMVKIRVLLFFRSELDVGRSIDSFTFFGLQEQVS